jgi:GNAT superfamily N-acetyltransferase
MATHLPPEDVITILDDHDGHDDSVVEQVSRLVNTVYRTAESGMWRDGTTRTTAAEVATLIEAAQIAVVIRSGHVVGSIFLHDVAHDATEFGMLAADPDHRGTGIGRALVDFAESAARRRGHRAMQLELLVPREWQHPSKEFLKAWYGRRGYRVVRTTTLDADHPNLAPLLATPCDVWVYEKSLVSSTREGKR